MRVPTKQLQELSDRLTLMPSAEKCLTWMFRRSPGYGEPFIVDLHAFNKWVGKSRRKGKYCPAMLRKIRLQLEEIPILRIKRVWRANLLEVVIMPLNKSQKIMNAVKSKRESNNRSSNCTAKDTEDRSQGEGYKQQQHYIAISSLLGRSGFNFAKEVIWSKIARYSAKAIARSIEYVKIQSTGRRPIRNREGYLIDCLERGYWKSLEDRETAKDYWQTAIDNFKNAAAVLQQKFEQLPNLEEYGEAIGSSCLAQLRSLLDSDYYGDKIISNAIAFADTKSKPLTSRRQGHGFGDSLQIVRCPRRGKGFKK